MAFKIADAFVEVTAHTNSIGVRVKQAVSGLASDAAPEAEKSGNAIGKKFMGGFLSNIRSPSTLKTFLATFAGVTAAALASVPALVSAGKWIGELGKAAGAASPALVGMGVVGGAAFATLKLGFSGFGTALKQGDTPAQIKKINQALADLHPEARATAYAVRSMQPEFEKIKRTVQGEIFKGLADDVKAVGTQFLDKAEPGMRRFGGAVNLVLQDLLSWGGSLAGVRATEQVTNSMYIGMSRLHPSISRVTSSFGNMIGRIAEVSTAAGVSGLGGVMDWLAEKMDKVNAATVSNGLADLNTKYHQVKDAIATVIDWVRQGIDFWTKYRTEIGYVQDGLAILAIAFGGPAIAVGAAVLLIIRHWDDLKAVWQNVVDYFNSTPGTQVMEDLQAAAENTKASLLRNYEEIKAVIGPVLEEIWDKITNKVIPAFAEFLAAVAPVVSWFRDTLGPIVAEEMHGVLEVISGVLDIITGVFQVFTGILTLDWSKTWEGIKNIASGAGQILKQIFLALGGQIVIDMFNKGMQLWRDFTGWVGRLRDDVGNFTNDMRHRALSAVVGLVGSVVIKAQDMWRDFTGWVGRLRDNTVGSIENMRDRVVGVLNSLKDGFWHTVNSISGIWNGLVNAVKQPVNLVIGGYNRVNDLWNGRDFAFMATGGRVPGSGDRDTVPAMLTPGEFVIRKGVAEPTRRFLEALNSGQAEAVQAAGGMFGRMQRFAEGGPVANAIRVAKSMHGKPYRWGGSGTSGTDCSGFIAYITRALRMEANPYQRIGTTASFPWPGFRPGLLSAFGVGNVAGSHMRGTLAGMNVESGGSHGYVAAGPPAKGAPYGSNFHLPSVGGAFVGGGGGGGLLKSAIRSAILAATDPILRMLPSAPPELQGIPRGAATRVRDGALEKALTFGFDQGGMLPPGMQYVRNDTSRPERVLSPDQTRAFERLVDWLDRPGGGRPVNVHVTQTSGSPAETGRSVALALRTVS